MPAPGHFGAAKLFGPTVCLKCTAAHNTPAHRSFVLSLVVKTGGPCPSPPRGIGPSCTLLSLAWAYDSAPFLCCGKFPSGVRQGPVIDSHLSGPCPRGLLWSGWPPWPTFGAHCRSSGRLVPPPLAGRAVAGFLILSPSPQSPHSRVGDDLVTLPHVVHEAGPEHLAPALSCYRLPSSSPPGILSNKYDVIMLPRLPCGVAVGDTPTRVVAPSLLTHHVSYLRSLRGCWVVETVKARGVPLSNLLPKMPVDAFTHASWYFPS